MVFLRGAARVGVPRHVEHCPWGLEDEHTERRHPRPPKPRHPRPRSGIQVSVSECLWFRRRSDLGGSECSVAGRVQRPPVDYSETYLGCLQGRRWADNEGHSARSEHRVEPQSPHNALLIFQSVGSFCPFKMPACCICPTTCTLVDGDNFIPCAPGQ